MQMRAILGRPFTLATIAVASIFYYVACSSAIYEATSPHALALHVLLRKAYSIGAFAVVGYLLRRALVENGSTRIAGTTVVAVAAYSASIEVGQFALGSKEGLLWNAFDTACGACGGALATLDLLGHRRA